MCLPTLHGLTAMMARRKADVLYVMLRSPFGKVPMKSSEFCHGSLPNVIVCADLLYLVRRRTAVML